MKKSFLLLSLLSLLLSCNNDTETIEPTTQDGNLLKKIKTTYSDGTSELIEFSYSGNKIVEIKDSNGYKYVYSYTNDNISKEVNYTNNTIKEEKFYNYNTMGFLVEIKTNLTQPIFNVKGYRSTFDNTNPENVLKKTYKINLNNQEELLSEGYDIRKNGDLLKSVIKFVNTSSSEEIQTNTFDSQKSPFRNILGFGKIYPVLVADHIEGIYNNVKTFSFSHSPSSSGSIEYIYNADGYPKQADVTTDFGSYKYKIEYIY